MPSSMESRTAVSPKVLPPVVTAVLAARRGRAGQPQASGAVPTNAAGSSRNRPLHPLQLKK